MKKIKDWASDNIELSVLTALFIFVLIVAAAVFGGNMYSAANMQSMAFQIPEFGFLALGMMVSNLIGGIDLSMIANANTVAIFTAFILNGTWPGPSNDILRIIFAIIVAILAAFLFGMFNGILISKTSAPPLIATLGTMTLFQGIGMAMTGGSSIGNLPDAFAVIGKGTIEGIPIIFLIFIIFAVILGMVLNKTSFGRKFYLYGGNPIASRFSAINNEKMCIETFVLTGLLAGIAGIIILSRVNSAKVGYGDSYLLQTLIVCTVGGIDPNGGKGKLQGVILAVFLMQILSSAFNIMNLSPYTKKLIWGMILLLVLGLNFLANKTYEKRKLKASMQLAK